jgi:hypothetical protein
MKAIGKQTYVFQTILEMLEDSDKVRMQLISKKFYDKIVPITLSSIRISKTAPHAKK